MAGGSAGVAAVRTGGGARLFAVALGQAVPPVADAGTAVHATGDEPVAGQPTGDVRQVAGDVAPSLGGGRTVCHHNRACKGSMHAGLFTVFCCGMNVAIPCLPLGGSG